MKMRCRNPNIHNASSYTGKGITFDPTWLDFNVFLHDMGIRPEGTTLDRIDNDKGYCKSNCRWATSREQWENRNDPRVQIHRDRMAARAEGEAHIPPPPLNPP